MVLVRVSDDDTCDFVLYLADIIKIWYHYIHSVHCAVGKTHTYVDDNRACVVLDDGEIAADFAKPANRRDAHLVRAGVVVFERVQAVFVYDFVRFNHLLHLNLPRLIACEFCG